MITLPINSPYGNVHELQNNLAYQKHLFNSSRKQGANFEELKKIHLRIRELERDIQAIKKKNISN